MIGDGGHLGYWQPYWKDLNIWSVFMTLFEHLLCLKHKIYFHNCLSQPSAARLRQKIGFQDSPWRPSWKKAAILKFCVARVFFLKGDPIEYLCQICCLYHNLNDSSAICNYLLHYKARPPTARSKIHPSKVGSIHRYLYQYCTYWCPITIGCPVIRGSFY